MHLLLLPHALSLVLSPRRWLPDSLTLRLLDRAFDSRLLHLPHHLSVVPSLRRLPSLGRLLPDLLASRLLQLLTTQVLHLLSRSTIAACCLSGKVGHLPLASLFIRDVWRLLLRLSCCRRRALISEL